MSRPISSPLRQHLALGGAVAWLSTLLVVGLCAPWLATQRPFRATYVGVQYHPYSDPAHAVPVHPEMDPRGYPDASEVDWRSLVGSNADWAPVPYSASSASGSMSDLGMQPPGFVPDIEGLSEGEATRFRHWLGTDKQGRDVLAWVIHGARNTFGTSLLAALVAWVVGLLIGSVSGFVGDERVKMRRSHAASLIVGGGFAWFYGYKVWQVPLNQAHPGHWPMVTIGLSITILIVAHMLGRRLSRGQVLRAIPVDSIINRLIETLDSLPGLLLLFTLASLIPDRDSGTLMFLLGLLGWPHMARLARAEMLRARALPYAETAVALGIPPWRIILFHLLPNVVGSLIVVYTFMAGTFLTLEASLAFLGLVRESVSWGSLLSNRENIRAWWLMLTPVVLIASTVISLNTLGQWIQARLDPRTPIHARLSWRDLLPTTSNRSH